MKNLIATLILTGAVTSAFAQGTINIDSSAGASTKFIVDNTGAKVAGTAYLVQLFYANGADQAEGTLQAVGATVSPRTGAAAGVLPAGTVLMDGINPAGGTATLQFRGWSAVLGATHDAAFAAWNAGTAGLYGRSATFNFDTANPVALPQPEAPAKLGALFPGMTLNPIPEPSTIALGLLGGFGALVLFRRRK